MTIKAWSTKLNTPIQVPIDISLSMVYFCFLGMLLGDKLPSYRLISKEEIKKSSMPQQLFNLTVTKWAGFASEITNTDNIGVYGKWLPIYPGLKSNLQVY